MKRALVILLVVCMSVLVVGGCGGNKEEAQKEQAQKSAQAEIARAKKIAEDMGETLISLGRLSTEVVERLDTSSSLEETIKMVGSYLPRYEKIAKTFNAQAQDFLELDLPDLEEASLSVAKESVRVYIQAVDAYRDAIKAISIGNVQEGIELIEYGGRLMSLGNDMLNHAGGLL